MTRSQATLNILLWNPSNDGKRCLGEASSHGRMRTMRIRLERSGAPAYMSLVSALTCFIVQDAALHALGTYLRITLATRVAHTSKFRHATSAHWRWCETWVRCQMWAVSWVWDFVSQATRSPPSAVHLSCRVCVCCVCVISLNLSIYIIQIYYCCHSLTDWLSLSLSLPVCLSLSLSVGLFPHSFNPCVCVCVCVSESVCLHIQRVKQCNSC